MDEVKVSYLERKPCRHCNKLYAVKYFEEHEAKCTNSPKEEAKKEMSKRNTKKLYEQLMKKYEEEQRKKKQELEQKDRLELEKARKEDKDFWMLEAIYKPDIPLKARSHGAAKKKINEVFGTINCTRCNGSGIWRGEYQVYGLNDRTCWQCWGAGKHVSKYLSRSFKEKVMAYFKDKQIE
jgi:hypothetical protein